MTDFCWFRLLRKCWYYFSGDMERLQKFWLAGACKKNDEEGESSMPLGILNFTSAFILLAGGMLLGGLLLLLEHVYFKFLRAKLRKWDKCGCCGLISLVSLRYWHSNNEFDYRLLVVWIYVKVLISRILLVSSMNPINT